MNKNGFLQTGCFAILEKYRYFLSFLFLIAFSTQTFGQNVPVTLSVTDTRLETVLDAIEQQTNYYFVYDTSIDVGKLVSVDADGKNLRDLLDELFRGTDISYSVANNSIALSLQPREVARARTVTGNVTDSDGNAVIGATITVKGQAIGVTTDPEGRYSITLPAGSNTLVYSFMGLETEEVDVGTRTQIDVILRTAALAIDDVVVTALGIKRSEKALSYNVQQVSADELTRVKDANLVNALSGKVAGVTINAGSGGVGSAAKVVMRGTKGIDKSNNALYVIDGIPMFNFGGEGSTVFGSSGSTEAIADINPEDIESLTVLTGAAASALYGNNAANGVIVVNTKRGSDDRTVVSVSSNIDLSNPFVLPEFQTRYGTGDLTVLGGSTIRSWGHLLNKDNYMGYSPRSDFFQTGVTYQNNVSVSTGNARNQTYFSAAAVNSDGIVPNTQYDRYNFTFRNTSKFYQDKVTLDLGASYIIQNDQNMINQGLYSNPVSSAYLFPRGDDWSMIKIFERYDASRKINTQYWPQGLGDYRLQNPYWIAYRNLKTNKKHRYMFNASLKYEILDWLDVSGRVRVDESVNDFEEKLFSSTDQTLAGANGSYHITRAKDRQVYADVLVNMNKTYGDFTFTANVGASISDLNYDALYSGGPIRDDGIPNVFNVYQLDNTLKNSTQSGWSEQTQSVFASVEVGYKSMYYLTVTGRNDWPSHLAGSTQSGFFYPSVGLSAILSEIFTLPRQISYLKLRGSFASVGLPPSRGLTTLTYSWDNDSQKWEEKTHYPIGNLKAERTDSWEVGLSAKFLGHFDLDLSLYYAKTYNQTFDPQLSVSSRYDKIYVQTGSVLNKGIEAGLGYTNRWNDWRLGSYATFSLNRNKILELVKDYIHPETGDLINLNRLSMSGLGRAEFILKPGGTLGDLYSITDFVRDINGNIYVDANGEISTKYEGVEDIKLGSVFPSYNLSWRNDISWKNLNLGFMISARVGGIVYSATQAALDYYGVSEATAAARDRGGVYINGGDLISAQTWYTTIGAQSGMPQYYTYSATNVRLQELSLGYTIPRSLTNFADITISVVGRNLWMIYNKAPFDPESVASTGNYYQGIDYFIMPSLRTVGMNVRIKF